MATIKNTSFSRKVRRMLGLDLDSWNLMMLWSLGGAALAAFAVVVSTAAVLKLQKAAEEDTKQEFERYKLESSKTIAAAELKTEQLRKELGPRHIQREIFLKALSGQPKANVEIMYLRDDPECFELSQQIWRALEDAEWKVIAPFPIPQNISPDSLKIPTAMSVDGQPSGVTIVTNSISEEESVAAKNQMLGEPWERTPWTVLMNALAQSLGGIKGHGGGPNRTPIGTLRIVVAPR
jgi:hypothetical protein